jgi:hypothetical protein
MTGVAAFRKSLSEASSNPKLVLTLYFSGLVLAFPVVFMARSITETVFGSSMAVGALLPGFDYTVVHDVFTHHGEALRTIIHLCYPVVLLGMFVNLFLAGGTLSLLAHNQSFALGTFIGSCGAYFGRFLKLWLVLVAIGIVTFVVLSIPFGIVTSALSEYGESEQVMILGTAVAAAFIFSPMVLVLLVADYAKVFLVVYEAQSVWTALARGFSFLFSNFRTVLMLHILLLSVLALAIGAYLTLESMIGMTSSITILAVFLLQQMFMLVRLWSRVAFFAGEVILYSGRRPRPVIFYGWDDSPRADIV